MRIIKIILLIMLITEIGLLITMAMRLRLLGLAKLVIVEGESELQWSILAQGWRILLTPEGVLILLTTITATALIVIITGTPDRIAEREVQETLTLYANRTYAAEQRCANAEQNAEQKYSAYYKTVLQQATEAQQRAQAAEIAAHRESKEAQQMKSQAVAEIQQARADIKHTRENAANEINQMKTAMLAEKKNAQTTMNNAEKRRRNAAAMATRIKNKQQKSV